MNKATQFVIAARPFLFFTLLVTWGGLLFAWLAFATAWALDDDPPIVMTGYTVSPAYPGGTMLAVADVQRDLSRHCDVIFSQRFVDSNGAFAPIEPNTIMSAADIRAAEKRTPGKLMFTVPTAFDVPPGKSLIVTSQQYFCNPWHTLWRPLPVTFEMQAEVLAR